MISERSSHCTHRRFDDQVRCLSAALYPRRPAAKKRGIFTIQSVGGEFPQQPFYLPYQPFGNCQCPTSVSLFSVTVRYGGTTCQNHVIYEVFATVSLRGWASRSYLFRGVLRFLVRRWMRCCLDTRQRCYRSSACNIKKLIFNSIHTYRIVTGEESGLQSAPCDPTTVTFWPNVRTSRTILKIPEK